MGRRLGDAGVRWRCVRSVSAESPSLVVTSPLQRLPPDRANNLTTPAHELQRALRGRRRSVQGKWERPDELSHELQPGSEEGPHMSRVRVPGRRRVFRLPRDTRRHQAITDDTGFVRRRAPTGPDSPISHRARGRTRLPIGSRRPDPAVSAGSGGGPSDRARGEPGVARRRGPWSPDGTQIVFRSDRGSVGTAPQGGRPDLHLWLVGADGTGLRRLTDGPGSDGDPSWMPDGRSIVFTSNRDSRGDIYRVWLADGRIERLTRNLAGRAIMPAVAPDGRRAAFAGQTLVRGKFWRTDYLLDLTSGEAQLLPTPGGACWPAWSPDGRLLLSVALDDEPSTVTLRELATNAVQPFVAHPKLWTYYPDWSSNGQFVAFSVSPAHYTGEDWDLAITAVVRPDQFMRLTHGAGNDRLPDGNRRVANRRSQMRLNQGRGRSPFSCPLGATNGSMSRQTAARGESMKSRESASSEGTRPLREERTMPGRERRSLQPTANWQVWTMGLRCAGADHDHLAHAQMICESPCARTTPQVHPPTTPASAPSSLSVRITRLRVCYSGSRYRIPRERMRRAWTVTARGWNRAPGLYFSGDFSRSRPFDAQINDDPVTPPDVRCDGSSD